MRPSVEKILINSAYDSSKFQNLDELKTNLSKSVSFYD